MASSLASTSYRVHSAKVTPFQRQQGVQRPRCTAVQASSVAGGSIRIGVQGRQLEVTPAINEYVTKKLSGAVEPFKSGVREVDVRLSVRGGDTGSKGGRQQKMEVTVRTVRHGVVRAEEVREDLYAAIDVGCDKVVRSLRKLKEKSISRGTWPGHRGGERGDDAIADAMPDVVDGDIVPSASVSKSATSGLGEVPDSVKRTKVFYLDQMSLADAVDRLAYVDHDFYLYLDKDSGHTQVVYTRNDGTHGVIITVPDETASAESM